MIGSEEHYIAIELVKWLARFPVGTEISPILAAPHIHHNHLAFSSQPGATTTGKTLDLVIGTLGTTIDATRVTDYTPVWLENPVIGLVRPTALYLKMNHSLFAVNDAKTITMRGGRIAAKKNGGTITAITPDGKTEYVDDPFVTAMFDEIYLRQTAAK